MKENMLDPNDIIATEKSQAGTIITQVVVEEDKGYIKATNNGITRLIDIYSLSARDVAIILLKTRHYFFSRCVKKDQLICTFQDLEQVLSLQNLIENVDIKRIIQILKFIDPFQLFHQALGVAIYKNNYEGINISLDEAIKNFANCKEKRLVENRPLINPLQPKKEEENA